MSEPTKRPKRDTELTQEEVQAILRAHIERHAGEEMPVFARQLLKGFREATANAIARAEACGVEVTGIKVPPRPIT